MKIKGCKACRARVFFAVYKLTGRRLVLDAAPVVDGEFFLRADGQASLVESEPRDRRADVGPRFRTHFASCDDPARFRRRDGHGPRMQKTGPA